MFVCLCVCSLIRSFVRSFVCSCTYLFVGCLAVAVGCEYCWWSKGFALFLVCIVAATATATVVVGGGAVAGVIKLLLLLVVMLLLLLLLLSHAITGTFGWLNNCSTVVNV